MMSECKTIKTRNRGQNDFQLKIVEECDFRDIFANIGNNNGSYNPHTKLQSRLVKYFCYWQNKNHRVSQLSCISPMYTVKLNSN